MTPSPPRPDSPSSAATLLVVDDDTTNRDLLSRRLVQQGFVVLTASDGPTALATLAAEPCDAVLLDVMMPGQSGLDVLTTIRADADTRHLPVIMVTARSDGRDIVEALELGASDYVTKPIDFPVALARVRAQLGRVTAERAALALQRHYDLQHAQKLSAMGQLTGGVAHDFNNLLATIQGYTEFLAEELPDDDPRRLYVAQIQKATDHAAGLTRQLLSFIRRQTVSPESLDLAAQTRAMASLLRRVIGDQIRLVVNIADGLWPVIGDAGQFDQVLLNLVVNACDAMPDGGRLVITLDNIAPTGRASAAESGCVRLSVADDGCGMDADTQARIFEPFFTTKPPGKGTGLGLAMVRTMAERFGAVVLVTSAPGDGATFEIRWPRADVAEAAPPVAAALLHDRLASGVVLLVEDDTDVRQTVRRLLIRHGYAVLEAASADETVAAAARPEAIDVLVTDVSMPGIGGADLWHAIRTTRPSLAVVFMSAHDISLHHDVRRTGYPVLEKPFTTEALLTAIRAARGRAVAAPVRPASGGE